MVKIEFKSAKDAEHITESTADTRPTSPHIQIYKWEWTMLYSILHRVTAMGCLVLGVLGLGILIVKNTFPITAYGILWLLSSVVAYPIWFLVFLSVAYFIFADLKYMLWERPVGLELKHAKLFGNTTVILSVITALGVLLCFTL